MERNYSSHGTSFLWTLSWFGRKVPDEEYCLVITNSSNYLYVVLSLNLQSACHNPGKLLCQWSLLQWPVAENTAQTSKTKQNLLFYISQSSEIKVIVGAVRNTLQDPVLSLTQAIAADGVCPTPGPCPQSHTSSSIAADGGCPTRPLTHPLDITISEKERISLPFNLKN